MYYYPFLDIYNIKKLAETAGRCSHEIRNLSAGYAKIEYPEIQIIDNISGQIEGIMREICGYLENSSDIKHLIRNAVRPNICLSRMFNEGNFINNLPVENLKKMKKILAFQSNCLKEMDDVVNKAILDDSKQNFGVFKYENIDKKEIMQEIMSDFDWKGDIEKFKLENEVKIPDFLDLNRYLAKFMCNYAHEIQNLCSKYVHKVPENAFTNKIINIAGKIEDSSRRIQDIIRNHNPKTVPNKSNYRANFYSTNIGICNEINDSIKQIEELAIEDKCSVKITNENLHKLLSAEANFNETIKQNMILGYKID